MNLLLFIMVLIVSFVIVRIGAIAFQLTGLEWSLAKFQALSCFTATGFTTREAELITSDPRRRRVASILIVLGHAGLVTLVATFANSLRSPRLTDKLKIPFLQAFIPGSLLPWINLAIIAVAMYIMYKVFTHTGFVRKFTDVLRRRIVKREIIKPVSCQELAVATGGYGVAKIRIREGHPILDKALLESELRRDDITVLAIVRGDKTIPNPTAETKILSGDELICFGKLGNIRKKFV